MAYAYEVHDMGVYGIWYGYLPKGCVYCMKGSKAVIFVSGICGIECYYCPISYERRKSNAFFVDEERFKNITDIIDEISMIKAEGASITGGEPLQRYHVVVKIIRFLKEIFGEEFHIHLYTSGYGATKEAIKKLSTVGLDEIRFHVINEDVMRLVEFSVRETEMDVGIEIPAIPEADWLWKIVFVASKIGAKFVNLNELEVSETNIDRVLIRGHRVREDGKSIEGSREAALKVIEKAYREKLAVSIHLCPATYKDEIQHKNRLRRKSLICASPGMSINSDGTISLDGVDSIPTIDICSDYIDVKKINK